MNPGKLIVFAGLMTYLNSVCIGMETVWLKDVTTTIQTDKRTLGDHTLPAQLTFHLMRGSGDLTLTLKRNYDIDPNADTYFVQSTKDGRSILTKTRNLEQEDVAYYQDIEHGAYMTVRCVSRLIHQCDREIVLMCARNKLTIYIYFSGHYDITKGNIQIGDSSYELRPADASDTSENSLDLPDMIGKRYLLLDERNIGLENLVGNEDALRETIVHGELKAIFRRITGQENQNYFRFRNGKNATLPPQKAGNVHNRGTIDKSRQLKEEYNVKVAVLIDSAVWHLYFSRENSVHAALKAPAVEKTIREAYSQVMNGVNLRYKSIEDPNISINIILQNFIFFKHESDFPHNRSKVIKQNGKTYVETKPYLDDLHDWDLTTGIKQLPQFDIAMLFTKHHLYEGSINITYAEGMAYMKGVCDIGDRTLVIGAKYYQRTVYTATHELGHSLGAFHDGEQDAVACKPEDSFIMTNHTPYLCKERPYVRNMWFFSNCSVESFRKTLRNKHCVKTAGAVYSIDEWNAFMKKQPGDVFTPQEQCILSYGLGSTYIGHVSEDICYLLRCTNPRGHRKKKYTNAPKGTTCGENKWCDKGRCVSKNSK